MKNLDLGGTSQLRAVFLAAAITGVTALLGSAAYVADNNDEWLVSAAEEGNLPGIKRAFLLGADVHASGDLAPQLAAWDGHMETVKLLFEHGADVHAKDGEALRLAALRGHTETEKLLHSYLDNDRPTISAAPSPGSALTPG